MIWLIEKRSTDKLIIKIIIGCSPGWIHCTAEVFVFTLLHSLLIKSDNHGEICQIAAFRYDATSDLATRAARQLAREASVRSPLGHYEAHASPSKCRCDMRRAPLLRATASVRDSNGDSVQSVQFEDSALMICSFVHWLFAYFPLPASYDQTRRSRYCSFPCNTHEPLDST